MDKIIYLVVVIAILFSYIIMEKFFKKFFPKLVKYQLWDSKAYYFWGGFLLIICFIVRPNEYIFKLPQSGWLSNWVGVLGVLYYLIATYNICVKNPFVYYPRKSSILRCLHFSIVQPVFEEMAFRGLILPITICLLGRNTFMVVIINAILFMFFHMSYWEFNKKNQLLFLNFFINGLLLCFIASITQSIIYPLLCHVIMNGLNTLYRNLKADKNKTNIKA